MWPFQIGFLHLAICSEGSSMSLHALIAHFFLVPNHVPLSGGSTIYPSKHWRTHSHFLSNLTKVGLHTDSLTLPLLNTTASLGLHLLATTLSLITWPPGHGNHLVFLWRHWPPLSLSFDSSSFWPLMWNSPDSYIQPPTSISTWPLHRHPNLTLPQLSSILLLRGFTRSVGGSCNSTSLYPGQKPYSLLISSCSLSHAPNLIANLTYVSIIKGCPDWTRLTILHSTTMVQVTKIFLMITVMVHQLDSLLCPASYTLLFKQQHSDPGKWVTWCFFLLPILQQCFASFAQVHKTQVYYGPYGPTWYDSHISPISSATTPYFYLAPARPAS